MSTAFDFSSIRLTTPRLVLRELREDDWQALQLGDRDPQVVRYQTNDVLDEAGTRAYLVRNIDSAKEHPRRVFDLAVTFAPDGEALGRVGVHVVRPEHHEAMVWFSLRRDAWGQGIGSEAAAAVLDFAFGPLGLHRVFGDCDPRNLGSARLMERLGMKREAHLHENYWVKGEWCDTYIYAVLADEWRALRAGG